jgi:cell division protein FtsW (lipid II flippase)
MWIALGLSLPLVLYAAACVYGLRIARSPRELFPQFAATVAAVWAMVAIGILVLGPDDWPDTTQVAWTGIEAKADAATPSLTIGGSEQTAVTAWPNGSFSPQVTITPNADGTRATLSIAKGGAFAILPSIESLLNGRELSEGQTKLIDGYRFELAERLPLPVFFRTGLFIRYRLRVYAPNGALVADLVIRRPGWFTRYRILSLEYLNTRSEKGVVKNRVYDNWSRPILIGITNRGLRILDRTSVARSGCDLPCSLRLRWRRGTLNLSIEKYQNVVRVRFARPWRHVSPLPEKNESGARQLVVTRQAQPGDFAFLLPLGGGVSDPRAPLWILDEAGRPRFAGADRPEAIYGGANEQAAVTSETEIAAGRYRFRFATSTDILHPGTVVVHLVLALACFIAGVILIGPRTVPEQRWIVCGIAAVLWAVLVFRVALAVRYALEPQFIDAISVKGLILSLFAATVVPGLVLLEGRLRCDAKVKMNRKQDSLRAGWHAIAYLAAIVFVALLQLGVADNVWPALPASLAPGLGARAPMLLILAIFGLRAAWMIRREYLAGGLRSTPLLSYERFADAAARFWRTVADRGRTTGVRWYLTIAGLFALLLLVLLAIPGSRVVQEVFAPLVLTLLPALLWLSSAQHFRDSNQASRLRPAMGMQIAFWTRMLFWAVLTVAIPVFAFPMVIGDPGSVLATLAVFLPLLLILFMASRALKPALAITACLLIAFALAALTYLRIEALYPLMKSMSFSGNVPARVIAFKRDERAQLDILRFSRTLEEAYTHTWENKAIGHEGGLRGIGFGQAPTRRSHVGQDTLQFDSVFSFFVVSEHGLLGGAALLLIYLVPSVLILIATRGRLTLATAFGLVICAAFFAEAWFHAAMNTGVVPFAGRNLPLLSVHSGSDMVKWLSLFVVAAGTAFWTTARKVNVAQPAPLEPIVSDQRRWQIHAAFAGFPLVLLCIVVWSGWRNVNDTKLAEPFTWDTLLESVSKLTRNGKLTLNGRAEIVLAPDVATDESLLVQQVNAFNQLPLNERIGEIRSSTLMSKLLGVRTPAGYEAVLREEATTQLDQPSPYPPLFRLMPEPERVDDFGILQLTGAPYRIEPNPEFNTRISFRPQPTESDLPRIFMADRRHGTFVLQGSAFSISVPRRTPLPYEDRTMELSVAGEELQLTSDTNPASPRGDVVLEGPDPRNRIRREPYFRFSIEQGKFLFIENQLRTALRVSRGSQQLSIPTGRRLQVYGGDRVQLPAQTMIDPAFSVFETDPPPLVGPAWVMGRWRSAWDPASPLPWTPYLATALELEAERIGAAETKKRYEMLTLDSALQQGAQTDVARIGHELHTRRLGRFAPIAVRACRGTADVVERAVQNAHPPRVALSVVSITDGSVLAMAGWPRTSPGALGKACTPSDTWCPPTVWIDRMAPSFVRSRYGGDRNFDRIEMGSSTKPILAAAALAVDPRIEDLRVAGPNGTESEVFGMAIPSKAWEVHYSPRWTDFASYLTQSDNRYQVRLGFLALARRGPDGQMQTEERRSPSVHESFDGTNEWRRYPVFPGAMKFSSRKTDGMVRIDDSPFAQKIRTMFGAGVRQGDFRIAQYSFWTLKGEDDAAPPPLPAPLQPDDKAPPLPISRAFEIVSPEVANLGFDYITNPRQYISLLLGGNNNRWANVEFAGAFASAVTGHPVVPHIVQSKTAPAPAASRQHFPAIAARLRPGLEGVVMSGTAAFARGKLVPPELAAIPGLKIYAKTGTLAATQDGTETSRLVIAMVRWSDETNGVVQKGLVLSLVAERAQLGDATRWLAQYITDHQEHLARYLQ